MKYLLFQSDDYGITNGVSDGILYGIKNGVVRNTGLFVNMASSKLSAQKLKISLVLMLVLILTMLQDILYLI